MSTSGDSLFDHRGERVAARALYARISNEEEGEAGVA